VKTDLDGIGILALRNLSDLIRHPPSSSDLMNTQPTLSSDLLLIRPLTPGDFDELAAVASDMAIWAQHPQSDRGAPGPFRKFFDESLATGGALVVIDRVTGRIIGSSRYFGHKPDDEVEVGWSFLARAYWGGRYNAEMKRLMLEHAFRFVPRVVFVVGPTNVRSQRAMEKIGGVRVADRMGADGSPKWVYEIRREEWAVGIVRDTS